MADKSVSTDSLAIEKKTAYAGKKFRVAIVGCGGIAQMHIFAYMKKIPGVDHRLRASDIRSGAHWRT